MGVDSYLEYASEKFNIAVRRLAVGEGDVCKRLLSAYMEIHPIEGKLLPEELQQLYAGIIRQLTKYTQEDPKWGTVPTTLNRITNKTGRKIATDICDLRDQIENLLRYNDLKKYNG